MLWPGVVLDILRNFTLFAADKKHRRIKIICRYQQYEAANLVSTICSTTTVFCR